MLSSVARGHIITFQGVSRCFIFSSDIINAITQCVIFSDKIILFSLATTSVISQHHTHTIQNNTLYNTKEVVKIKTDV